MSRGRTLAAAATLVGLAAGLPGCGRPGGPVPDPPGPGRPLVLTTDPGADMDDQWVLAHLALSPEFDVRGVVTTHIGGHPYLAAPAAETTARIAREVLARLPLAARPPVWAGSSVALRDKAVPLPSAGVDFLLREARGFDPDRRLTVLVIGAATDVASALLTDPTLAGRIEVVAMAFNRWPDGTDPFNVKNDVKAWQVLLESPVPLVVGDTAVTARHLRMTRLRAKELLYSRGGPGRYLADLFVTWLEKNGDLAQEVAGDRHSWPVWDEVAVAHLLGLTRSAVHPRPRLRDDLTFEHPPAGQPPAATVTWVTAIDAERLWADLARKVERAARHGPTATPP